MEWPTPQLVSVEFLQQCKLWKGSMEETTYRFVGRLTLEEVQDKIDRMEGCDDLTSDENEYLAALLLTKDDAVRRGIQ